MLASARTTKTAFVLSFTPSCLPCAVCVCGKPRDRCGGHVPQGLPEGLSAGAAHPGPVGRLLFSGPCDVNRGESRAQRERWEQHSTRKACLGIGLGGAEVISQL